MSINGIRGRIAGLLEKYPFTNFCFERYVDWVFGQVNVDITDFDLIRILDSASEGLWSLEGVEQLLNRARQILQMTEEEFRSRFGFRDDLLTRDKEKIHDIFAGPLIVVELDDHNFKNIQKLPENKKINDKRSKIADFKADFGNESFAIELKTIRTESWAENGKPLGDPRKPSWWKTMFENNCITKIEDKNRRVIEQLENTCKSFGCSKKMLVLYNRRVGPSTLMHEQDYYEIAENILKRYPQIDFLGMKDYFGNIMLFYPNLRSGE